MILVHDDTVWVRLEDGGLVAFAPGRLAGCIRRAAGCWADAGDDMADWIAAAVQDYGRRHAPARTLTPAAIAEMVEAVLAMLGFEDWATAYRGRRGAAEIRLDELAAVEGAGFELAFYRRLDRALAGVLQQTAARVQVRGLRACVLRLRGARRWTPRCRRLADDIVHHVCARTVRWHGSDARPMRLAIGD